jgi:hypothetical protein
MADNPFRMLVLRRHIGSTAGSSGTISRSSGSSLDENLEKTAWIVAQDGVFWPTLNSGARPALHKPGSGNIFDFAKEDNPLPSMRDSRLRDGLAGSREGSSREVFSLPVLPSDVFSG